MAKASLRKGLLISLVTLVLFPLLAEVGLRAAGFRYPPRHKPPIIWNREEDVGLKRGGLFMRAPRQLWSPRPGAADPWDEGARINDDGYRGPLLPREKTPGVLRVATLGDSSTFGMGVPWADTYTARLPAALAEHGIEADSLGGGVIGFTIRQGIERYVELVRPYRPDVVVVAFGAVNEHFPAIDLPDELKIQHNVQRRGALAQLKRRMRRDLRLGHLLGWMADERRGGREAIRVERLREEKHDHDLAKTHGQIDWQGTRRVSHEEFAANLRRLQALIEEDGAQMVVVSMPRHDEEENKWPVLPLYNAEVRRFSQESEVPMLGARGVIRKQLVKGRTWDELFVDHFHPSVAGHALLAERLASVIAQAIAEG